MDRDVRLRPSAAADLNGIYDYISQFSADRALAFTNRIDRFLSGLSTLPERGIRRDDIRQGLRIISFERRVTIAFCVLPGAVEISRVIYGGRDIAPLLKVSENEA